MGIWCTAFTAHILKITGNISALALLDQPGQKTAVSVVAEEGLEPPTQGL